MRSKRLISTGVLLLFGVVGFVPFAHASPITYTVTATATGSLGGSAFTDALVTLTVTADTSNVTGGPILFNNAGPATVNVAGIGTATLTDGGAFAFSNKQGGPAGTGAAGIEASGGVGDILDTVSTAFGTYDLKTAIGPITGAVLGNSGPFGTSLGQLTLLATGNSTFTATGGGLTTPTLQTSPSPASGVVGVTLRDSATLSGGTKPTGTITFKLFPPTDASCAGSSVDTETVTVNGNGTYSTPTGFVSNASGTWHWTASYSGDATNNPASSACGAQAVTVVPLSTTPVPTLTEWGWLMFTLLLVGITLLSLRRRATPGAA